MTQAQSATDTVKNFIQKRRQNDTVRARIVNTLEYTYGPILAALGFSLFFSQTDASVEVILGLISSLNDIPLVWNTGGLWQHITPLMCSLLMLIGVQVMCFSAALSTLDVVKNDKKIDHSDDWAEWILVVIPIACCSNVLLGFLAAANSDESPGFKAGTVVILGAVILAMLVHGALSCYWVIWGKSIKDSAWFGFLKGLFLVAAFFILMQAVGIGLFSPGKGVWIGPVGLVATFAVTIALILSSLTAASVMTPGSFPLILLAIPILAAMSSQEIAAIATTVMLLITAATWKNSGKTVRQWLGWSTAILWLMLFLPDVVPDCEGLSGCNLRAGVETKGTPPDHMADALLRMPEPLDPKTPLRIVAAQGGGLFAAHHTATYLAARADSDPEFAQSLFAISGVSGGSVGAGVYWAIRKSGLCENGAPDCNLNAARDILERDYLSPALAGLLFRDNADNFVPASAVLTSLGLGPIDRGRGLENALSGALSDWQRSVQDTDEPPELFEMSIEDSFDPARGAPLLFMNVTRVDTGEKYVFSPVRTYRPLSTSDEAYIADPNDPETYARFRLANGNGLKVGAAMVTSARFPVVTPPARLRQHIHRDEDSGTTLQFVDGGYYDNSGIETALDIALALRDAGVQRPIDIIFLTVDEIKDDISKQPEMKGTLGAPSSGFFAAWRARIALSETRLADAFRNPKRGKNVRVCKKPLKADGFNFTLSWYLAPHSFNSIATQMSTMAQRDALGPVGCQLASTLR